MFLIQLDLEFHARWMLAVFVIVGFSDTESHKINHLLADFAWDYRPGRI